MKSCQWLFILLFTWIGALNAQTSTIHIQWDPNNEPDINHYQLQRAVNSTSNFQNYQTVYHPDTDYWDTNISAGNLYAYRVSAVNDNGMMSAYSTPVIAGLPKVALQLSSAPAAQPLTISKSSFLSDPDHNVQELLIQVSGQNHVSVTVQNSSITLNASPANYSGPASFTIRAEDPAGFYDVQTVSFEFIDNPPALPLISSFSPTSGSVGTTVSILGDNFNGASSVTFNGTSASFTVVSNSQISTTVPPGAGSGPIRVTTPEGTALSSSDFTVLNYFTLNIHTNGTGSVVLNPPGGNYLPGTTVTLTAVPDPGYLFSTWSGDVSSNTNPVTVTMDGNKTISAIFVAEGGGGGGIVVYRETQTGGASGSSTVSTGGSLNGDSGDLYLAAVSSKNHEMVELVEGLGLDWTPVRAQCAGRNQTGVTVWMARSETPASGMVTAHFGSTPYNAVIAVSRYSGTDPLNPLGMIVSANTNGSGGDCANGTDNDHYSVDLATSTIGGAVYGAVALRQRQHLASGGFIERAEVSAGSGGGTAGLVVQDRNYNTPSAVQLSGSFSKNVDWALIGIELRAGSGATPQYALTVNTVGAGTVALDPNGGIYPAGSSVDLTALPAPGWTFDHWEDDLSGNANPASIIMNDNKAVTAVFTELPPGQFVLSVTTSGAGTVDLNPPGGIYSDGTPVTLTANPAAGWEFYGWSGDLSGATNPAMVVMDADKDIHAIFTQPGGVATIVHEESHSGGSARANTVSTETNLSAVGGDFYLAAISTKPNVAVNAVSGLGLTWSRALAQCSGRDQTGIEIWIGQGSPDSDGPVNAVLEQDPENAAIIATRFSGVDPINPFGHTVSGNSNGENGGCSGGTDSDYYSFEITTSVPGAHVFSAAGVRLKTHTPGNGYNELLEYIQGVGGAAAGVAVQERLVETPDEVIVDGTLKSKTDWAMGALELLPAASGSIVSRPVGSGQVLMPKIAFNDDGGPIGNSSSGGSEYRHYLKFKVENVDGIVRRARLRLHAGEGRPEPSAVYQAENAFRDSSRPWHGKELNRTNAPQRSEKPLSIAGPVAKAGWIDLDVTAAINGPGIYSFAIPAGERLAGLSGSQPAVKLLIETISGDAANQRFAARPGSQPLTNLTTAATEDLVVYPNPLKPSEGHQEMIFANLPEQTRRIGLYSFIGERIYETEIDQAAGEYRLDIKSQGLKVPSGLYIYMVKDDKSRVLKSGKVVVVQ